MSARKSLFVCAALLTALLAPPAAAKPADSAARGNARPAAASVQRDATTPPPTNSRTGEAPPPATKQVAKDRAQKTDSTSASKASKAGAKRPGQPSAEVIDGRRLTRTRPDVIDGRDAAAVRALYRKHEAAAKKSGSATRRAGSPAEGRGELRGATTEQRRPATRRPAPSATPPDEARARLDSAGSIADVRSDMSNHTGLKDHADADMSMKTDAKKPRRRASEDGDAALAAAGPRPTSPCAAGLGAAPALQFDRTRTTLREFSWADMAEFFATAADEAEPEPLQVGHEGALPAEEAIRRSGLPRKALDGLAHARAVDLLTERELVRIDKALTGASPTAIAALLQADSPSLRAHVWTWLATTPAGVCALVKLDGRMVDAAIRDRSVAVEHGEDLVFRPLGDYALAARSRLAAADPQAYDALLRSLWSDPSVDPRVRALVAGLRVRRGHAESIEAGLRDPAASVRGATAVAAIDRDRARYEGRMIDHAADDPADLVTELIVGELLGGSDPRGELAERREARLVAALNRLGGRGDPLAPLPAPKHPLRFPATKRAEPTPMIAAAPAEPAPTHVEADEEPTPPRPLAHSPAPARREAEASGPRLPSVLDDVDGSPLRP